MNPHSRFRIHAPQVANETIDGEVVIINFVTGAYYSLDSTGACIWGLVELGATVGEMAADVCDRYQGNREEIESAVRQFVSELRREELIVPQADATLAPQKKCDDLAAATGADGKPSFEVPVLSKYDDMQNLLLLDPIHEIDDAGWPVTKPSTTE